MKFTLLLMLVLNVLVLNAQDVLGPNIILNSSFDTNEAGWSNYFDYAWAPNDPYAATGSVTVVTKAGYTGNPYKVSIMNAGSQNYSVQIAYPMALGANKKYAMKFKASANAARTVSFNLITTPTVFGPY